MLWWVVAAVRQTVMRGQAVAVVALHAREVSVGRVLREYMQGYQAQYHGLGSVAKALRVPYSDNQELL